MGATSSEERRRRFRQVIDGEAHREGLLIVRIRFLGGVEFVGFRLGLGAGNEFRSRQRQQVAEFRRVDKVLPAQNASVTGLCVTHSDGLHVVSVDIGGGDSREADHKY